MARIGDGLRLADHQRSRQIVRDGTAWVLLACGLLIMLAIDLLLLVCGLLMELLMDLLLLVCELVMDWVLLACGLLMGLLLYKYW